MRREQEPLPYLFPLSSLLTSQLFNAGGGGDLISSADGDVIGFDSSRVLFLLPSLLLFQGGSMDLSKVGEKILSSVRSARSLGVLPPSDRPEVPERAAVAAAVARALAGLPLHQRYGLPWSSEELKSIYASAGPQEEVVEELEDVFYEEDFNPIRHVLDHLPSEENELAYFEKQATLRIAQLDRVAECLSRHVMENHEVMVKGMNLVRELEKDLRIANIICMNGRRHITSSMNEVSRDLIVNSNSKKKQALLDMLPVLNELRHALDMQAALESLVEEGNYCKAFQVLSEYLQLLDSFSELSAIQEMSRGVEVWLGRTLQKLDSLLLGVCVEFKEENYITVIDAYALIGDVSGLAEKIQSFFMQEVLSETHSVLKSIVLEDHEEHMQNSRLTYSDLCLQIPDSKFRQCLLRTLAVLFELMCSYHEIMNFQLENEDLPYQSTNVMTKSERLLNSREVLPSDSTSETGANNGAFSQSANVLSGLPSEESNSNVPLAYSTNTIDSSSSDLHDQVYEARDSGSATSSSESPWYQLRKDTTAFVAQTLQRGRRNLWQLSASRVSVLLSSTAASSTSIHQFLKNYEDLNVFILAGEAFCGVEAIEFRQKLKAVCEHYFSAFHRQSIHALKMVLEKEHWVNLPPDTVQVISFAGLLGDGAPLIVPSDSNTGNSRIPLPQKLLDSADSTAKKSGFTNWLKNGNPFSQKLTNMTKEAHSPSQRNGGVSGYSHGHDSDIFSPKCSDGNLVNGNPTSEDENEDLLADFIDEDSQLPSRISKTSHSRSSSLHLKKDDVIAQTGSSLCLLRSMDKYARLMQKLEIVNVEFFKGICQLFEVFFYFVYETFGHLSTGSNGKALSDSLNYRLKTALLRVTQDCDQWIKPHLSPLSSSSPSVVDVTPTSPQTHIPAASFDLQERCTGADTVSLVARILHRSKAHLQSMLLQNNPAIVEDFYANVVDSVPDLTRHIHRTTARLLLHVNGYVDRIANAKWEVKELGLEHNGYVDLLLGEFKHYKTRLAHGGIPKEVQDLLLEYGVEIVAETLVEGLSRVKRCTDEGRALMSLDLQVLINGLQHFVSENVKPKFLTVDTFIKAYYLPETEYVHWARAHPEYSKSQIVGLVNLVATMKGWKRKTRLEVLEKIE